MSEDYQNLLVLVMDGQFEEALDAAKMMPSSQIIDDYIITLTQRIQMDIDKAEKSDDSEESCSSSLSASESEREEEESSSSDEYSDNDSYYSETHYYSRVKT